MRKIILTLTMMLFATQALAMETPNLPAAVAIQRLKDGNDRFLTYQMKHPNQLKSRRDKLINGQHPFAIIVSCTDSRVSPEIIFDQGLGDILVIRNTGNVIDEKVISSIDYAVHHSGANLVVVLGHEFCDEIGAAMKEGAENPVIENIRESIKPAVTMCKEEDKYSFENVIKAHAKLSANTILEDKDISDYIKKHDLKIISAYYSIGNGKVEFSK